MESVVDFFNPSFLPFKTFFFIWRLLLLRFSVVEFLAGMLQHRAVAFGFSGVSFLACTRGSFECLSWIFSFPEFTRHGCGLFSFIKWLSFPWSRTFCVLDAYVLPFSPFLTLCKSTFLVWILSLHRLHSLASLLLLFWFFIFAGSPCV